MCRSDCADQRNWCSHTTKSGFLTTMSTVIYRYLYLLPSVDRSSGAKCVVGVQHLGDLNLCMWLTTTWWSEEDKGKGSFISLLLSTG